MTYSLQKKKKLNEFMASLDIKHWVTSIEHLQINRQLK